MTITPEEADRALEEAIEKCAEAYEWEGIRIGHVLLVEHQVLHSDDTTSTSMGYHAPSRQTWTSTLGIIRAGTLRIEHDYVTHD